MASVSIPYIASCDKPFRAGESKACHRCGETKPIGAFPVLKRVRSGLHPYCLDCRRAYAREYWRGKYVPHPRIQTDTKSCSACKQVKPKTDFYPARGKGETGRQSFCKVCTAYRNIERFYGLSRQDYDALIAAQGGKCAICQEVDAKLAVDHCHETGRVRGMLCKGCNRAIARIERAGFLSKALEYLNHPPSELLPVSSGKRIDGSRSQKITDQWAKAIGLVQWRSA